MPRTEVAGGHWVGRSWARRRKACEEWRSRAAADCEMQLSKETVIFCFGHLPPTKPSLSHHAAFSILDWSWKERRVAFASSFQYPSFSVSCSRIIQSHLFQMKSVGFNAVWKQSASLSLMNLTSKPVQINWNLVWPFQDAISDCVNGSVNDRCNKLIRVEEKAVWATE